MRALTACGAAWLALWLLTWASFGLSLLVALSCALTIGTLYIAAVASQARGWPLFWLLGFLYGGIAVINIQLESLVFSVVPTAEVIRSTAVGLLEAAVVSALLSLGLTGNPQGLARRSFSGGGRIETVRHLPRRLWLRMLAFSLSYVILYSTAGTLILPFVRHFYMGNDVIVIPPLGVIVGTQVVRGLIYGVALLPLLREMDGRRAHAALIAGLSLAVLGGIAPLLLPVDDILPPDVRAAHMLEIFGSNFMLGVIAGVLFVRRSGPGLSNDALRHAHAAIASSRRWRAVLKK